MCRSLLNARSPQEAVQKLQASPGMYVQSAVGTSVYQNVSVCIILYMTETKLKSRKSNTKLFTIYIYIYFVCLFSSRTE